MKTKLTVIASIILCANLFAAEVKPPTPPNPVAPPTPAKAESLFTTGLTLDLAGTYSDAKAKFDDTFDHSARGGRWGVAVGATYWLHEYVGVGADAVLPDWNNVDRHWVGNANVSGYLRYPFGKIAPYALGGVGRNFTAGDYTIHAGAGVEYRIQPHVGLFAEARYIWGFYRSPEYAQARVGIRFAF